LINILEWISEFNHSHSPSPLPLYPEERARMENAFRAHPLSANHTWQNDFLDHPPPEVAQHFHTMPATSDAAFMRDFTYSGPGIYSPPLMSDLKGKNKMVELDNTKWEEQFRAFEDSMKDDEANKAIDEELSTQEGEQFFGDFQSIWNGIRAEEEANYDTENVDFLGFTDSTIDSQDVFDGKPDLGDYLFEPDNPYLNHPDPYSEGLRLLEAGGSLSEAALAFEAGCQMDSTRVEGWTHLGTIQAQNEKELAAIRALEQAIRLDESNMPALMVCCSPLFTL
jgi:peroxin-5